MNASEPLMTCRKSEDDVETGWERKPGTKPRRDLSTVWAASGIKECISLEQASMGNKGTCRPDVKERPQVGQPGESASTDAGHRDGTIRSSFDDEETRLSKGVVLFGHLHRPTRKRRSL
jgi:hypothetical protein